ncbi:hypothetical protein AtubIFM54640_000914 [Aspergillus tubingensis]|nr:hypothetical protein AtubIFM54640_000914 [Aspergillus tubingensis]
MEGNSECVQYLIEVGKANVNVAVSRRIGNVLTMAVMMWRLKLMDTSVKLRLTMTSGPLDTFQFEFGQGDIVKALLAAGASVVSDLGDGVIADAFEVFYRGTSPEVRPEITTDEESRMMVAAEKTWDMFDYGITNAVGKATLAELHTAMWQQYKSGTLGIEEARYVEGMYREENIPRLSERELKLVSEYFEKGRVLDFESPLF